ncbi:MAG: shikimate dehydrogenase [bacterium]|nr:shikimate dehydrogenase [bacterium]
MKITGKTKVVGLMGYPLSHTISPSIHTAAFSWLGLNWVYLPFEVQPKYLKEAIFGLKPLGIAGVNITIPHKVEALAYMDGLSPEAELIGAINTIVVKEDGLFGDNTDGKGFIRSLKETGFSASKKRVALIGAGGAGKAIGISLAREGADTLYIFDANKERKESLISYIKDRFDTLVLEMKDPSVIMDIDLLVNATPCGMKEDDPLPIDTDIIPAGLLVYDIIYNPQKTRLLENAERKGAKILSGLAMLVYQAALSFSAWTDIMPPTDVMMDAAKSELVKIQ